MLLSGKIVWPSLFVADEFGGKAHYGLSLLIPKGDKQMEEIGAVVDALIAEKCDGNSPADENLCVKDCDDNEKSGEDFQGHYLIKIKSQSRPAVVDADVQPIIDPDEVRGGDYVNVTCDFFAWDFKGKQGISCGLNNVQHVKKGEHVIGSSKTNASDDFQPIASPSGDTGNTSRF